MNMAAQLGAVARLDFAEVRRSRWLLFCLLVYATLGGLFVLVGLRESSVLGFTGMGRVLLSLSHALVFLLPLIGLMATGQVINSARHDGTLELLFSQPLDRTGYFLGVTLVRSAVLIAPLLLLLPGLAVAGWLLYGQAVPWSFLLRALLVSTSLLLCSVALGLLVSTLVRNQARALMLVLLLWAGFSVLVDFALIGMMLQWRLPPELVFALAALNPVQDARMALLATADPDLATLGPVGFFLATRIGETGLLALGIAWPLVLGAAAWWATLLRFRHGDLT